MFLLDTNVISETIRSRPNPGVLAFFEDKNTLHSSVICFSELFYGVNNLQTKEKKHLVTWIDSIESTINWLTCDQEITRCAAKLRILSNKKGVVLNLADALIAATAAEHGFVLVTRNINDFKETGINILNPFSK